MSEKQPSRNGKLELDQVHQLIRLLTEARALPASQSQRGPHLLSGLARIVGATAGIAILVTDLASARNGRHSERILFEWHGAALSSPEALGQVVSAIEPVLRAMMRITPGEPGAALTATWNELVSDRARYGLAHVEPRLHPIHLADAVVSSVRLRSRSQLHGLGLYRERERVPFSEEERNLVHLFHAECEDLLHASSPGASDDDRVSARARLSPRQRQALDLVLSGLCDKEIAERLGISRYTVNQYTKVIYRHYAVTSRAQLLARVLAQPESGAPNLRD